MVRRDKRATATDRALRGTARLGRRTKDLIKELRPGQIAVIDHADIDRVAGDGLAESGVIAVVNAAPSITGRYPNLGPGRVLAAGVALVDEAEGVMESLVDGEEIVIDEGRILRGADTVASGVRRDLPGVQADMAAARETIGAELRQFAQNTLEYVDREAHLTFEPLVLPDLTTPIDGRHALIVVRGHDYREDLKALRHYIAEYQPVLIGVDGGADALLEQRHQPDIIIGDFDSVTAEALEEATDLVHHVHPDGRAPGRDELADFGVDYVEFVVEGTSEDAAMLLAHDAGAELIVAVGTHATMVEFLDKGRPGMASTFLTRLRLGPDLVDAKGVSRLYEGRVRRRDIVYLIAAAMTVVVVMAIVSESLRVFLDGFWLTLRDLWLNFTDAF